MLEDNELKNTIRVMLTGVSAANTLQIAMNAIDKMCNGYERSNTDVYEEMIREIIKMKRGGCDEEDG